MHLNPNAGVFNINQEMKKKPMKVWLKFDLNLKIRPSTYELVKDHCLWFRQTYISICIQLPLLMQ